MVLWWWTELLNIWVCVWIRSVIKSKTYKICKMNKNETFNEQCWLFLQRKTAASRSKSTNDAVVPNERRLFAKKKSGRDKSEEGCLRSDTWRRRLQRRKAAMKKDGSEAQELPALSRSKSLDLSSSATSAKSVGSAGVLAQEDTSTLPIENSPITFGKIWRETYLIFWSSPF